MKGKINGNLFEAETFGFDGCHKVYICTNKEGERQLLELGYDLLPIEGLPEIWTQTCWLRFIMSADLKQSFVRQGEPATFEGWDVSPETQEALDLMSAASDIPWD